MLNTSPRVRMPGALTIVIVFATAASGTGQAQYPEKPITILVGYGPGSGGDLIARALADAGKKYLRTPMIVVNRAGAGGTMAIAEAIRAKADGYTLGLGTAGTLTLQPHETSLSYGSPETYVPVAKLVTQPNVLMVRAGARWRTAREFLDDARVHPGQLTVSVPGAGTVAHVNVAQIKLVGKVDLRAAFFEGPKQVDAALTGRIDASLAVPGATMPHVKAGRGVALAVVAEHRMSLAPDVPTFKELGFDVILGSFQAIIAPRGTPRPVLNVLDEAISKIVNEPSFISAAEATESTIDYKGSEAFAAELRQAFEDNRRLIQLLGIREP